MRVPKRPPSRAELFKHIEPERLERILRVVTEPMVSGKYLHWDDLRHRTPPEGLDLSEWWLGLAMQRTLGARQIALRDVNGRPFSYRGTESVEYFLHRVDLEAGGSIKAPAEVTNPDTQRRYLVRSLIEEAITSSQLEGAATTREVAREMIREERPPRDQSERMILNNYRTMQRIGELRHEKLTQDLVFDLHRLVTEHTLDDPPAAGRFRRDDEYRVVGDEFGEVFHRPPPYQQLERRMADMCAFANESGEQGFVHPALRAMILHFWLAYDHPFVDGNGRTARALFYWSMLHHGYWLFEYISISEIILKGPVRYGEAFLQTETDNNDLTYFLIYHLDVINAAIAKLHRYVDKRGQEIRALDDRLRGIGELNHRQRELIRHALRHPGFVYTIESHKTSHGVVYQTARTDLLNLGERGLLKKRKRGQTWTFTPVKDLEARLREGKR
jgi:Fic family protein